MANRSVVFIKDPNAILDYEVIWEPWLPGVDLIVASEWIVTGTLVVESSSFTDTTTTVWLSGGTVDERETVTNRITTADGRTEDYSFQINIKEK